ncbi:MAG TPA: EAL domain-containing protein, partial [Gammaproteobacteria bacterium]|nr:EAL domain-containing protein [Gammaproteobacteria bacterium]
TPAEQGWVLVNEAPLSEVYSVAWQHMLATDSGQFRTSKGLFTFATVYPGEQVDSAVSGASQFWKIVSHIDSDTLAAATTAHFRQGLLVYLLLLVPAAIVALYLAKLRASRLYNRERIRELGTVIEQTHDMVLITDANGIVRYVNPRFEEITGYGSGEIIGRKPNLLKSGTHEPAFYERLWSTIQRGKPFEATITNRKKNGQLFHVQMTISPLTNKRGISGFVATAKDITGQVSSQERLLMLAFHHPLTGLPNRALFRDHLHEAAARARRSEHSIAVLFIDLDRFKKVNDSLGHQVGDVLLKEVAQRLRNAVREIDTVAHLGGDEFILLLDAIQQPAQVRAVATKLLQLFEQPFMVAERELHISASIGIAIFPEDSNLGENDNVELLIERADTAMYQAKRAGRGQFQFYSAEMTTLANERLELENQLRNALQQQEFELHFQPIVDPLRRELRGLEALIRWRHPSGELRRPDEFIPTLEETGLVIPTTEWVLEEACRQCRHLHAAGMTRIRMNVNISARSFYQGNLVKMVAAALQRTGMPPTQLVLEMTESVLLEDQYHIQNSLEQLRELGVGIAIDDFGTGYSSLSYLRRLPVDTIKIDRSFIHGVGPDSRDAALVSAMMAMAQELQLDVVAEGVEQAHQLDFLRQRGCDGAQGFLFSGPLPAKLINDWLDRDRNWPWKAWMDRGETWRLH